MTETLVRGLSPGAEPLPAEELIELTIDGRPVLVAPGATLWEAARQAGIDIPVLCHDPQMDPVAVCRVCVVEVEGARVLPAACIRQCEKGMTVHTRSERVEASRRMVVELLMADHPAPCPRHRDSRSCELELLAEAYATPRGRLPATRRWAGRGRDESQAPEALDSSSPVIAVDHAACILCDRCIRGCDEIQVNQVIGRTGKGFETRIAFDTDQPMGASSCVACGECMARCPTGALTDKPLVAPIRLDLLQPVSSVCPYCGVGCAVTLHTQEEKVVRVTGRSEGPANQGRLCVKGRYGFDYSSHPQRLTRPLIRRPEFYPKGALSEDVQGEGDYRRKRKGMQVDYGRILPAFREATWDEALDLCAQRFLQIRQQYGSGALAGFGSAKCTNEDNFLFQKLIRAVFGTNNVDHCTRLCHASSVAALMEGIGSGSVSNPFSDVAQAEVCIVIGSNAEENHPVAASFIKQAAARGTTLICIDPRKPQLTRHADHYIRFKPGTDVALLNAMMHVILREGLHDEQFIAARTEGWDEMLPVIRRYTPELAARITGVPAKQIEEVARIYGRSRRAMIFWGMGISQHTTGTDNSRCLIALALMTGNIGRAGTGLHPLRGQNNVQGASDVGLIPMVYSGYQPVTDPEVRRKFEQQWGVELDPNPGLTVVEIMREAQAGKIRGMLIMGENPFLSDPNINKVRKALSALEFLAVQDIFLTETAEFADVILPASSHAEKQGTYINTDRWVQLADRATPPPGDAREDWQVLQDLARRMGYPMEYSSPEEIWKEVALLTPVFAGVTYGRLRRAPLVWPCRDESDPGEAVLFTGEFPRGRGRFAPADFIEPQELPDHEFPYVLNTGRVLQHWHTGTMSRRARALDEIQPEPFVELNPGDAVQLGIGEGDAVRISSRRGSVTAPARITSRVSPGSVFMPFHFREAAANVLTNDALDPTAKIPEFKYCAVRLEPAARLDAEDAAAV